MTATEMHDLLLECRKALENDATSKGTHEGFRHIEYCNYCYYSIPHIAEHGHSSTCLIDRLRRATSA